MRSCRRVSAFILVLLLSVSVSAQTVKNVHVTVRSRKTVLIRSAKIARDFPAKKRAIVIQPVFSGLPQAVLKQLRATLDVKNIFGSTLNEYRDDAWLEEFSYKVYYNLRGILDIAYTQSGSGAYPDQETKHFVVDLNTGRVIKASEIFVSDQLKKLADLVDAQLQAEIQQILLETGEEGKSAYDSRDKLKFEIKDLENFSVRPTGITFLFDAGFPHVIQALQPQGEYFVSYDQLKSYLRHEGQLGQFIR